MILEHAIKLLAANGFITEAQFSNFMKSEKGGEPFYDLSNDYSYEQARAYFACAFDGNLTPTADKETVDKVWFNRLRASDRLRFEQTYKQFAKYQDGEPLKLYRGVVIYDGSELDLSDAGVCWTYSPRLARRWAEDAFERAVYIRHINPDKAKMYVVSGITTIDNARLPYSIWLAGRFERGEKEVRLKRSIPKNRLTYKII